MTQRLLMICLDAADIELLRQGMADDTLPHLARLHQQGGLMTLHSSADWLSGSAWATHHTGQMSGEHGHYHYIQWRAENMAVQRVTPDWAGLQPYWRDIARQGKRVIAFDVPHTFKPEPQPNLIEICGWATHDILAPYFVVPETIKPWLHKAHGKPIRQNEYYGLMSLRRFGRIRDELVNSITRTTGVAIDLLQQQPWDLFLMAISATHRGGHRLWDLSSINQTIPAAQRADLENALQTVYQSADAAVGRLISAAGPDTRVVVYAVHGMGANTSYSEILPQMLARILGQETETSLDLSRRVRDAIPLAWRQSIKHALPFVLQDKLTAHWRMAQSDWQQTQGLTVVADNQGYIRINLRGREAAGIVEPGAEYDQLCDKIIAGLSSFVDSESGQPVVKAVARSADVIEPGARSHLLPDIIVRWSQETRHWRRAITSPAFGIIEWPTPGQLPDGRSGNHHNRGFWLSGSPLASPSQTATRPYHTIDIAPTVYDLLNLSPPPHLRGHSLYPRKKSDGD